MEPDPEDDPAFMALVWRAARQLGWVLPETTEEVAMEEKGLSFHSGYAIELEDGGRAFVTHYGLDCARNGYGDLRTGLRLHPPDTLLTPRDIAVLSGQLLGFAFDQPRRETPETTVTMADMEALEARRAEKDRVERDVRGVILGEPEPTE